MDYEDTSALAMMMPLLIKCVLYAACIIAASIIGEKKNRKRLCLCLGLLLGPVGVLVSLFLKKKGK